MPGIAAVARRSHDTARSDWSQLQWLVPLIGGIVLIVFLAQHGKAPNRSCGETKDVSL